MNERRHSMAPALAAAAALHAALLWALVFMTQPQFLPAGTAVPITLVASGPTTDSRPAEAAPTAQEAQVETPVPEAKAPVPPPAAKAQPAPPAPQPKPTLLATRPAPAPAKPAPPKDTFSLDALQASIARAARSEPARPATARRGPTRAETAPTPRVDAGSGVSQSDIAGLSQLLERLWNPDCSVDGPDRIVIPVRFAVGDDGRLIGGVSAGGRESSADPVVFAAARRAIDAAHQAAPYGAPYRGKSFTVRFDAEKACAQR